MKALFFMIGSVFLIVLAIFLIDLSRLGSIWKPVFSEFEIQIPKLNESVYMKKKLWGITHGHQVIWLSSQPLKEVMYDSTTDYIFKGSTPLYYKVMDDSLKIYTRKASSVPIDFKARVKVIQIELDNSAMMELLESHEINDIKKLD